MAVSIVQSTTGAGATLVLNGVAAGNALIFIDSYYRGTSTGVGEAVPTDSNGTFLAAVNAVPATNSGADIGVGIFYQQNVASGTHTVTPQANDDHHSTLIEFSGLVTSGMFVAGSKNSANVNDSSETSQVTGTTATAAAIGDLMVIAFCCGNFGTGTTNMGLTDPISGFTTAYVMQNNKSDLAAMQCYGTAAAATTQSATFNWTDNGGGNECIQAAIATFVAGTGGAAAQVPYNQARIFQPFIAQ